MNGALSPSAFLTYGWRIPFLLSIALVGLGIAVHARLEDTPAFRELQESLQMARRARVLDSSENPRAARTPVLEALRVYPRSIVIASLANVAGILGFYILITYAVAYGTSSDGLHLPRSVLLSAVLIGTLAMAPALLLSGVLSDRWGARRVFMVGIGLVGAWTFVTFPLIQTRSPLLIDLAIAVGLCFVSLVAGPLARLFSDLFRTNVRYTAVSLAYQASAVLGGALAPIVATALYARFRSNVGISLYVASACLISLACACGLGRARTLDEARAHALSV